MRVVLISADTDGDTDFTRWQQALVQDASGLPGIELVPLIGKVSTEAVTRAVRKGGDVLLVIGHHATKGLELSGEEKDTLKGKKGDREYIDASALASYAKWFRLVYLLSCATLDEAQVIVGSSSTDVVCYVPLLDVADAYRTGSLFLEALSTTGDFRQAYEKSRPPTQREATYLYLSATTSRDRDMTLNTSDEINRRFEATERDIHRLIEQMDKISISLQEVRQLIDHNTTLVEVMRSSPPGLSNTTLLVIIAFVFLIAVTGFLLVLRGSL